MSATCTESRHKFGTADNYWPKTYCSISNIKKQVNKIVQKQDMFVNHHAPAHMVVNFNDNSKLASPHKEYEY